MLYRSISPDSCGLLLWAHVEIDRQTDGLTTYRFMNPAPDSSLRGHWAVPVIIKYQVRLYSGTAGWTPSATMTLGGIAVLREIPATNN